MSAEDREKGRAAFKAQQWSEAISHFSSVLETNPSDVVCLSIRSSAYQKLGHHAEALADAHRTILVQPTYVRGYIRKACVLRAMKEYGQEVDNFLLGLEHCPGDPSLLRGLQGAQNLKLHSSNASQAAKITQATKLAALSRRQKANQATDLAAFVQQTHKNLQLEGLALQAQLDLIQEMNSLPEGEKLDLVHSWFSSVAVPKISDLYYVVEAIKQAAASLPFADQINQALERVNYQYLPSPEDESSGTMTRAGLETFLKALVHEMNITLADLLQFIVCQVLFAEAPDHREQDIPQHQQPHELSPPRAPEKRQTRRQRQHAVEVQNRVTKLTTIAAPKSVLNDTRVQHLFVLFDKNSDATVNFKEVALGLYPLTKNMSEAAKKAAGLLLMVDRHDERELSYEQFAKLILAVAAAFSMSFDELADQLTYELAHQSGAPVDPSIMEEIMVAEEAYAVASEKRKEQDQKKKTLDALLYNRTQKLFELWDKNGDGKIDFTELLRGLRRHQQAAMGSTSSAVTERDALMIMGHDDDHNQALDPEEFAYAMVNYAEKVGTTLHELIDFMCVVSSGTTETLEYEKKFAETMRQARANGENFKPSMGTILDAASDPEGDDDEDDDW